MIVSPSGSLFRLKSAVLEFGLLDSSFGLTDGRQLENVRQTNRNVASRLTGSQDLTEPAAPQGDQLVLAVAAERGAAMFALPSQRQVTSYSLPDTAAAVVAKVVDWGGDKRSPLLLLFTVDGKVKALSLPTLRNLLDTPLVQHNNPRIHKTISFSTTAAGIYFCNQNQVADPPFLEICQSLCFRSRSFR